MKKISLFAIFGLLAAFLTGCNDSKRDDNNVISERYIHKYGYAVSKQDWEERNYPGQVVSVLENGVTITSTFENGTKHGATTHTFPHSQTVEHYCLYNQGNCVKEIRYDLNGTPIREWVQLSPMRHSITRWYEQGSPMMVEEFAGQELIEGQYLSTNNDYEGRVEKGSGLAVRRDRKGTLLSKETYEAGYPIKKETFYANGAPESIAYLHRNHLHGEKRTYAQNGEPLSIEEWVDGQLHGKATYYKNGNRYLEIAYSYGQKNGTERHYIDGDIVSQEISWENDLKHGPSNVYFDGKAERHWFYAGEELSKRKYDEMTDGGELITISPFREIASSR